MKVRHLFPLISQYLEMQIGDRKTFKPLTSKTCLAFNEGELDEYMNCEIYSIRLSIDKSGSPYMLIWIDPRSHE